MTEWDGRVLALLAPEVDERAAKQVFLAERARRRRTRRVVGSTGAAAALLLIVALLAAVVWADDGTTVDTRPAGQRPSVWHDEGPFPDRRSGVTIVSSGSKVFVYGGVAHAEDEEYPAGPGYPPGYKGYTGTPLIEGLEYDVAARRWSAIPPAPLPFLGFDVQAAWTGQELLVWGTDYDRLGPTTSTAAGALYDPVERTWRAMAQQDFVVFGSGVWTGDLFVVVGPPRGATGRVSAAAYDPETNVWRGLADPPLANAASPPFGVVAWTGTSVLATSGDGNVVLGDPAAGTWRKAAPAPPPFDKRRASTFVWTGSELLQLGGGTPSSPGDDTLSEEGGAAAYDPSADAWVVLAGVPDGPGAGVRHGRGALFFGEQTRRYDSDSKAWSTLAAPPKPVQGSAWDGSSLWAVGADLPTPADANPVRRLLRYGP